jgi:hypothetical protein
MTDAVKTTDHGTIRQWVEERNGKPANVAGTSKGAEEVGLVRIDFTDDSEDDRSLDAISWDEFFDKFEEKQLAFLYQDQKANGEPSTFNKFVSR